MLTVLMATRDRARLLQDVLAHYCRLDAPTDGWKVVVVNNGSRDDTEDVVAASRRVLPIACVQEPQQGKNAALNAGLRHIEGDLVVLTDDDAFPRQDWLCQIRRAADSLQNFSIFGGSVVPRWEVPPAEWLLKWVPAGPTFTLTDVSTPDGPTDAHNVFGPNMAIRSALLVGGVKFDEAIGPQGRDYAMGSETELVRRLIRGGHKAWFVRDAVVEHFIRRSQMTEAWTLERAKRFGRGQYRLSVLGAQLSAGTPTVGGVPRHMLSQLALSTAAAAKAALVGNREERYRSRWTLNYIRGQIAEAYAMRPL